MKQKEKKMGKREKSAWLEGERDEGNKCCAGESEKRVSVLVCLRLL